MNVKISVFFICVEAFIYLLFYNLHDYNFKQIPNLQAFSKFQRLELQVHLVCYRISYNNCHPEVFLGKAAPKICSKFTREHPYGSVICKATLLKSHFSVGALL